MKSCSLCKVEKSLDEFSVNTRNKTDGRQSKCKECNRKYYLRNQEKIATRVNEHYHEKNKEILERRTELRKRPEAKEKKAEQDRIYYEENKEEISEYQKEYAFDHREDLNKNYTNWYHRDVAHARILMKTKQHKRRMNKISNGNNTLSTLQVENLLASHPYCEYCGARDEVILCIEHIVPLSRGGQNCIENVTIACKSCNSSKGNKTLLEWNDTKFLARKGS